MGFPYVDANNPPGLRLPRSPRSVKVLREVSGGYTSARRCIVEHDGGGTGFLKQATDEDTADWLASEQAAYRLLGPRPWLPAVLGAGDGWLLLEDLSGARWPPPWEPGDVDRARAVLDEVHGSTVEGFPRWEDTGIDLAKWADVDVAAVAALGVCSSGWLEAALPDLVAADQAAVLVGTDLCHNDVRSDNLCFAADGQTVLVDWNWAAVGNGALDLVAWIPSLALEGGPRPAEALPDADPALVALCAGFWAFHAPEPPPFPGSDLRTLQRRTLEVTLPWAAERLGLPPPR